MLYLLYQHKNEKTRGYREFKAKEDLTKFLFENSKLFLSWKIIEGEEKYEMKLMPTKEYEKPICKKCGGELPLGRATGYCSKCLSDKRFEGSERICSTLGCETRITEWNKTGLCQRCYTKSQNDQRREERMVERMLKEKELKERVPRKGKCNVCKKEFDLEDWQNPAMHWCPNCRKKKIYRDYEAHLGPGKRR